MARSPDAFPTCVRCRAPVLVGDLALQDHEDWYHVRCATTLSPEERPREFVDQQRASEAKIAKGRASSSKRSGSREETPIVRCVVCGTGIARAADLALTDSGPTHVTCLAPC